MLWLFNKQLLDHYRQAFWTAAIQLDNEIHWHAGHAGIGGCAGHFRVLVTDVRLNGL